MPEPLLWNRAADRHALVHQRRERHPPAVAGPAQHLLVRDAGVGEEHLVELGLPGHLAQRADLDRRVLHVDDERGEPGVLDGIRIGPDHEQPPLGQVRERRPHLLAVDDPLVTVLHTGRRQAGEIGSRAGLGEQLTPDLLAGEQRPEVALLLGIAPPRHHGRAAHAVTDRVAVHRVRRARRVHLLVDQLLQLRVEAEATEPLGEVHPGEAPVVLLAEEHLRVGRRRRERRQQLVDELGDALLVRGQVGAGVGHRHGANGTPGPPTGPSRVGWSCQLVVSSRSSSWSRILVPGSRALSPVTRQPSRLE